jgi:hypothetical protein
VLVDLLDQWDLDAAAIGIAINAPTTPRMAVPSSVASSTAAEEISTERPRIRGPIR